MSSQLSIPSVNVLWTPSRVVVELRWTPGRRGKHVRRLLWCLFFSALALFLQRRGKIGRGAATSVVRPPLVKKAVSGKASPSIRLSVGLDAAGMKVVDRCVLAYLFRHGSSLMLCENGGSVGWIPMAEGNRVFSGQAETAVPQVVLFTRSFLFGSFVGVPPLLNMYVLAS